MGLVKAVFINMDDKNKTQIPVLFNPAEYTITRSNQLREMKNTSGVNHNINFLYQNMDTMELELFLDTTGSGEDVRIPAYRIVRLTKINETTKNPYNLMFVWGNLAFSCVMERVQQHYEQFSPAGWPLRAKLTVSLKGYDKSESVLEANPSSLKPAGQVVKEGQTLQEIAQNVTGIRENGGLSPVPTK